MGPTTTFWIVLAHLFVLGCTPVKVSQDYDPQADWAQYGAWQWRHPVQPRSGDIRVDNPLLDARIRRAVDAHLAGRHIPRTDTRADFEVSYHLTIESRVQSDTYYGHFGGYYDPWYGGVGTETRVYQYDIASLIIDMHAADTGDLLWRGVGTYRLRSYKSPQAEAAAMQVIVDKILERFPPARGG